MSKHTHACRECGFVWSCEGVGKGSICEVDKAAQVNKEGPVCILCYHITMARRYAAHRGMELGISLRKP